MIPLVVARRKNPSEQRFPPFFDFLKEVSPLDWASSLNDTVSKSFIGSGLNPSINYVRQETFINFTLIPYKCRPNRTLKQKIFPSCF